MHKIIITIVTILLAGSWVAGQINHEPVQDNGGGYFENSCYKLSSSIGQSAIGIAGNVYYMNQAGFITRSTTSAVTIPDYSKNTKLPEKIEIGLPYPNPFNSICQIKIAIPLQAEVTLKLYDINGRELYKMKESRSAGNYKLRIDAGDLSSGVYFYSINAGNKDSKGRLVLVK